MRSVVTTDGKVGRERRIGGTALARVKNERPSEVQKMKELTSDKCSQCLNQSNEES